MPKYAQLNNEGKCVSVSHLSGEVDSPLMKLLDEEDDVKPGDIFDGVTWTRPDPPPPPEQGPDLFEKVATLEEENAALTLELVNTQIRLDQSEQSQSELILTLVSGGVI